MSLFVRIRQLFRALLFYAGFGIIVVVSSFICCVFAFLPFPLLQRITTYGNRLILGWLWVVCNIDVKVTGEENIPDGPCVILSNHQSTWDGFFMQWFFQPASMILKRELLWIPIFGWSLYFMRPIAIERDNPAAAIRSILKHGQRRLKEGNRIVIYPEGTRGNPDKLSGFKSSGAAIAKKACVDILPIAHDAGKYWLHHSFLKQSGTIRLHIGPVINSAFGSPRDLTKQARDWIESAL
jgi:1-acyl-sn-glycerol-3-phosphate acyltransferase